jgi:phospholipid/cholesterol/gamma-HCH transport system substrate-binding protein
METKSSHVLVGAVAIALFIALFLFILWIARVDPSAKQEYDIFFRSVTGLARGTPVNFSGVPVGTIKDIRLMPESPEFVRVRVQVDEGVPILQGTVATVEGVGFTGVSVIELEGAIKEAPPISEEGPFGVPVIPTKPGALGQLLDSAPQLLQRLSTLAARLNEVLNPDNQESISGILKNTDKFTGSLAGRSDEIAATIVEARSALSGIAAAADDVAKLANSTTALVDTDGRPLAAELRKTLQQSQRTLGELEKASLAAQTSIDGLNARTLPEVAELVSDLRAMSASIGAIAAKLDEDPAGALVGGRRLPDYEPGAERNSR